MVVYNTIFKRMVALGIIDQDGKPRFNEALKLKSGGFMDLNLDMLYEENGNYTIAMAHNYIQNGDVMADPDMEIKIIPSMKMAEALSFRQDGSIPINQHVYEEVDGKTELPEAFNPGRDFIRELLSGESGGGMTNTGAAIINCDTAGKPLRGFKEYTSGPGKYSTGTLFCSGHYISVNVERHGDEIHVDVVKSTVRFPINTVETIWQYNGHTDDLSYPADVEIYAPAIQAALDKTQCYHCRCLHFYDREV